MKLNPRSILYSKEMSPLEFNFETLAAPSLYNWLDYNDIDSLQWIVNSVKYASKIDQKKDMINQLLIKRGCHKIGGGTNRVVYAPYECNVNCFKIALDKVGIKANYAENYNQNFIKPYVCKSFEVEANTGVVGNYERVKAVQSREEYISIAPDIYDLITTKILGKYVMEDIGTNYMFNYGVRPGFGVVLIDYAMLFELDGSKLYCNNMINGFPCGGEIDYDEGFNHLYCTKCGMHYQARKLASAIHKQEIKIMKEENDMSLVSQLVIGGKVMSESDGSTETIQEKEVAGVIKTRKVKMTPKEIKKYEQEQRRKQKEEQRKKQEERGPIGVIEDNTQQTIGDVVGDALKDFIKQENIQTTMPYYTEPTTYEYHETRTDYSAREKNDYFYQDDRETYSVTKDDEDDNVSLDPKSIQDAMMGSDDEEPDYSSYGLEPTEEIEQDEDEQDEDDTKSDKEDSLKNFVPNKKKVNQRRLENL
jgi:hypothetical protein